MKESRYSSEPNRCIFRFTGNSEQDCRKQGGTPNLVSFTNGVLIIDNINSYIDYSQKFQGVCSLRIKFKSFTPHRYKYFFSFWKRAVSNEYFRIYNNSAVFSTKTTGTIYVNGQATTSTAGTVTEIIIAGITLDADEIVLANYSVGGANADTANEIELVEIYNYTTTAEEVSNLYEGKRFRALVSPDEILNVNALSGSIDDGYVVSDVFTSTWKTDNVGPSGDTEIALPLEAGGIYDFLVDWGDGNSDTITVWNQAETTHTYAGAGTYTVQISGAIKGWRFNNGGDKLKILTVDNWGDLLLGAFSGNYFYGCTNLVVNATDELDVSAITNFNYAFYGCTSMTAINVGSWDVSNVTSFRACFRNCTVLATLDVSSWDVGSVSNFIDIFQDCLNINNLDVSLWDVSSGTNFEYAFHGCKALATLNVSAWNTSNATIFEYMFGDIGGMIVNVIGVDNWDITSVTTMVNMFRSITLTTATYDAILIAWAAQAVQNNVSFHAGNSTYTLGGAAEAAHDHLTDGGGHNWTITDGGGI